jgi:hypothetical protein
VLLHPAGDVVEILVAAAGQIDQDVLGGGAFGGFSNRGGEGVGAFEGSNDVFGLYPMVK